MYALRGRGWFQIEGLTPSSSLDTDTETGENTHHPTIYSIMKCNQDLVKGNG